MKFILSILVFISLQSQAQIINASSPYRVRAAASCAKLLDTYSGAAAAYSLRKLDCDYTGYAIKVRRSSDNTESDIGFTANGDLDTASLKTFVGTGGTDDGFVVTWYDQSGSNNMTQSTAVYQPIIMDNGSINRLDGLPTVGFDGANDFMTESVSSSQPYTIFIAALIPNASPGGWKVVLDGDPVSAAPGILFKTTIIQQTLIYAGTVLGDNTERSGKTLSSALFNGGSSFFYHNNTLIASGSAGAVSLTQFVIGKNWNSAHYLNTKYYELVIYNSDQSANRTGIQTNINTYWQVY